MRVRSALPIVVLVVLAAGSFVAGYFGWLHSFAPAGRADRSTIERSAWLALRALSLSDQYNDARDWRLVTAKWLGGVFFGWVVLGALTVFLRDRLQALRARFARGHVLVVGDGRTAELAAAMLARRRRPVFWLTDSAPGAGSVIRLPRSRDAEYDLKAASAARAHLLLVAPEQDTASVALVKAARDIGVRDTRILLQSPALRDSLHLMLGEHRYFVTAEAEATAADVIGKHPPNLLARRAAQARIQAMIVGAGRVGQAIAREIVLSCHTTGLGQPHLIFFGAGGDAEAKLLTRNPGLRQTCTLEFRGAEMLMPQGEAPALAGLTCIYVCSALSSDALETAVAFQEQMSRGDLSPVPIFVRVADDASLEAAGGVSHLRPAQLVGFGGRESAIAASGLLDEDPDAAARAYHARYQAFMTQARSARSWDDLEEPFRIANRRAIAHIPAKLASAGFDLEPWLAGEDRRRLPSLAPGEPLFRTQGEREALARLEHERWTADRLLDGWRFAPVRDDSRKRHDALLPFDQLSESLRDYDRQLVDFTAELLGHAHDGLRRRVVS